MDIFVIDNCGKLWEFTDVYKIENFHHIDECIMLFYTDSHFNKCWHWFTCSEIVSMEILV